MDIYRGGGVGCTSVGCVSLYIVLECLCPSAHHYDHPYITTVTYPLNRITACSIRIMSWNCCMLSKYFQTFYTSNLTYS